MIAVAIVGMALGMERAIQRRKVRYLRLAQYHIEQLETWRHEALKHMGCGWGDVLPSYATIEERERAYVELQTRVSGPRAGYALKRSFEHRHLIEYYDDCATHPLRNWGVDIGIWGLTKRTKPTVTHDDLTLE